MMKQKGPACRQAGQAAILIIFVIGMISILIGISLVKTGFNESIMGRATSKSLNAFYAANSGIEEAFYRLNHGSTNPGSFAVTAGESNAQVQISGAGNQKTIEAVGTYKNFVRKIKVEVEISELAPGFKYAVHAGNGGFILAGAEKNFVIGNVYSNQRVQGFKKDCDKSAIKGTVWAVNSITKYKNGQGPCIEENAFTPNFIEGYVLPPGQIITSPAPTPIPLPAFNLSLLKNRLTLGITSECSEAGPGTLGDIIVNGDLTIDNNLSICGPVWVKGKLTIKKDVIITISNLVSEPIGQIVLVDGLIEVESGTNFPTKVIQGKNTYVIFISEAPPVGNIDDWCDNPAITLKTHSQGALFYSLNSCVLINTESSSGAGYYFGSVIGQKIMLDTNASLEYDPGLSGAVFGLTSGGGWQTVSFKEE